MLEKGQSGGGTLIELLVVLGILMAMIKILFPRILTATDKKQAAALMKQVSKIQAGLMSWQTDSTGHPISYLFSPFGNVWN